MVVLIQMLMLLSAGMFVFWGGTEIISFGVWLMSDFPVILPLIFVVIGAAICFAVVVWLLAIWNMITS